MAKDKFSTSNPSGPVCPQCHQPFTNVTDVRYCKQQREFGIPATRRRRVCLMCDHRFTTFEVTKAGIGHLMRSRKIVSDKMLKEFLDKTKAGFRRYQEERGNL